MKKALLVFTVLSAMAFAGTAYCASLTLTIPDEIAGDVVRAVAISWGYQEMITLPTRQYVPNPQTRAEYIKEHLRDMIKDAYVNGKAQEKVDEASVPIDTIRENAIAEYEEKSEGITVK